jgi:addiction module HigA family antidote
MRKLKNVHPGEVLKEEFLVPLGITPYRLAKEIYVPQTRISEICKRRRSITADTACRLAKFFGTSQKFWMNLQDSYDLEEYNRTHSKELLDINPFESAVG